MKLTNNKLIEIMLSSGISPNKLIDILFLVSKIIKKYGKVLFDKRYIKEVSCVDKNLSDILIFLYSAKKTSYEDIKKLIILIKRISPEYFLQFSVVSDSEYHNQIIRKHIKNKFKKSEIYLSNKGDKGIYVFGEGRYYKRDLDSDLRKILGG